MTRILAIVTAMGLLGSAASAEPLHLQNGQLDQVTAGGLSLGVGTLASSSAPSSVTFPAPLGGPLTVSKAADVTITIGAITPPAITQIVHP